MSIFKKIIEGEIKADIVYEDELCLAFKDIDPQGPQHVLLIPRKEIRSLAETTEDDKDLLGHMLVTAGQVAKKLGIDESGFRLVINTNEHGGQTVFHLHMHIIGGRPMTWPPG